MSKPSIYVYSKDLLVPFERVHDMRKKDGPIEIVIVDSIPPIDIRKAEEELSKEYKFEEIVNMSIKKSRSMVSDTLNKNDIATLIKIGKKKIENKAEEEKKEEIMLDEKEGKYTFYRNVAEISRAIYYYLNSTKNINNSTVINVGHYISTINPLLILEYSKKVGMQDMKFIETYLHPVMSYLISHKPLMVTDGGFADSSTIARIVDHIYPEKGCGCGGNCHSNSSKDKKFKLTIHQGVPAGSHTENNMYDELKPTAISASSEKDTPTKFLAEVIIRESFGKLNGDKQDELISIIRDAVDHLEQCDFIDIDKYRAAAELGMFKLDEYSKYYNSDEEYTTLTNVIKDRVKYLEKLEKYSKYITSLYDIAIGLESWKHIAAGARDIRIKDLKLALLTGGIINQGDYALELLDLAVRFHESYILTKCGPTSKWGSREDNINNIVKNLYIFVDVK